MAELAWTGLSSKDIAARLSLSVPMVANHLQHAYAKLGVTGPEELMTVWHRTAPRPQGPSGTP